MRQEAQAIVLAAGPGMRMTALTSHTAKCLLPLGTLPMLCYPLHLLQQAGFTEVSGGRRGSGAECQQGGGAVQPQGGPGWAVVSTAHDPGTADSLRQIASKIKKSVEDVIVISSDLVTDVQLQDIMDQHRGRGADLTVLTSPTPCLQTHPPGPKTKTHLNSDIICTEAGTGRLVYVVAGGDYDESVVLQSSLLHCAAPLLLSSSTQDAHLYIMKRWLLDYVLNKESPCADMGSLKAEILPHIVSCQFSSEQHTSGKLKLSGAVEREEWDDLGRKYNSSVIPSRHHSQANPQPPVCLTFHHPGLCVRANTLHTYWHLNRKIHEIFDQVYPNSEWQLRHSSAEISERAQVSEDSVVGAGAVVCDKTNICSSVVGKHCRVSPMVRLTGTVLGDHVTLVSGVHVNDETDDISALWVPSCVIENSLILASVEKKCTIKNCIVTDPNKIEENKELSSTWHMVMDSLYIFHEGL
ncbi:Translation initiation factor eIF-2B subunit gamma [Chionoecetes opilio]|uniref:Translation initiation factor eIF2B subunit gamma n=1 Tax=Chionoecetes opilio TaxID=41210 RepID=A0A8J4YS95_CHIOP|nr:Translation initiation factor eIF-2B subunit gamma [Chionoecetes opilio]